MKKEHRNFRQRPIFVTPVALSVLAALFLGWTLLRAWDAAQLTTVILVRHAEKATQPAGDPPLSAAGAARADDLARALAGAGVDAIYTTEFLRTRDTAAPLARRLDLQPTTLDGDATDDLVRRLRNRHSGDTVLVVGHSNTLPEIASGLGVEIPPIGEADYDNLYVISTSRLRGRSRVRLRYGAPSPSP